MKIHLPLLLLFLCGCELPPRGEQATQQTRSSDVVEGNIENEEYVMVTTAVTMPMYVNHDQAAFKR